MSIRRVNIDKNGNVKFFNSKNEEIYKKNPTISEMQEKLKDRLISHFKRNQKIYTSSMLFTSYMLYSSTGFAATPTGAGELGGKNLIILLQKASFWLGMGVTIWGIVEAMLDFPGWKGRILKGALGYIGILLVPLLFIEVQNSLEVSVWNQIDGSRR